MITPRVKRQEDGSLLLEGLSPAFLHALHDLPSLLGRDQPDAVRRRLYPLPSEREETNEEWRRLVHPDLFALLASARDIVLSDLASLEVDGEPSLLGSWRVRIPAAHIQGWLSALNAARLALGALYDLEENDLRDDTEAETWDERQIAVAKVHLLGWLQQLILEEQNPPPPGFDLTPPDEGS